ncbi:XRE family transcriptional regulator [Paenibacillus yonginensis]|uniref:XRE family transcriptional regulator n=1 Tax=Paenibacillus yonginensis TaxID=1462996 RepID=A0A1B1MWY8_9BACL|nr:helix-turn-helix transcriptional regulator [Paenibacillus yonginensis]ANS73701.1 XRE family transcriptional regulator [Paenibacillus yonginensis]
MSLGERIRERRKQLGFTQLEIAQQLNMGRSNFGHIENGRVIPSSTDLDKLADILQTKPDYLLGKTDDPSLGGNDDPYALTFKEEKDIAIRLQKMLDELESDVPLAYFGEPLDDDEDREALKASLENTLRLSKYMAKKKFTPNKYRK